MNSFHIIIQQERRTPVVRSYKDYIGRREQQTEIDPEDGEQYTTSVMIDADDPAAWETYTQEDRSRMAIPISKSEPTGNTIDDMPEYVAGPVQLHIMATRAEIYKGRIKSALANGWEEIALILQEQAAMGIVPDFSDPQYVMVVEWDGNPNYVICHKGDYSTRTMGYAGWPDITKEQYDALAIDTPAA